jgi:hypothetical protein
MWCHRRFTWHYTCNASEQAFALALQVRGVLEQLVAETPQFFHDAAVTGMAFGVLEFQVTISDRDQWWVARRARFLVDALRQQTELPLMLVNEQKAKLSPHPNRGKYRLRRLRKEARSG